MGNANTINNQTIEEQKQAKKSHWKIYIHLLLVIILLAAIGYSYLLLRAKQSNEIQIAELLDQVSEKDQIIAKQTKFITAVKQEKRRCELFANQDEGDFDEFEYCLRINDWFDQLETKQ